MKEICKYLITVLAIILVGNIVDGQDWSQIGKTIQYSKSLKNAKKYKNVYKALKNPENVFHLRIRVGDDEENLELFIKNVHRFKNLRKLEIFPKNSYRFEQLVFPDTFFYNLPNLEYLDITSLNISSFVDIGDLSRLKFLQLVFLNIAELPTQILQLDSLQYLNLSLNKLKTIPQNIIALNHLREIKLGDNCFTEIPKALTLVSNLEYIHMNNVEGNRFYYSDGTSVCKNRLDKFPMNLDKLPNLKSITLSKCPMSLSIKNQLKFNYKLFQIKF